MQAHITGGVVALWFSVVGSAFAQGHEDHAAGEGKASTGASETREHLQRAKEELKQAGESAADDTHKAMKEAREEAREKLKEARETAARAAAEARDKARELGGEAAEAAQRGAEEAQRALQRASEVARETFRETADKLDDSDSPDDKRRARRNHERHETWRRLREQMKAKGHGEPPKLDLPLKTELAVHARRSARLARIRDLALENDDPKAVAKVDTLLERERQRHERRVEMLTAHADPGEPQGSEAPP
jgi:hypothetical protein